MVEDRATDREIERLLRATGARVRPPVETEREVRAAVHAEWRAVVAARQVSRRTSWYAAAAGFAVVGLAVWLARPMLVEPPVSAVAASLVRSTGVVEQSPGGAGRWQAVGAADALMTGTELRTGPTARAALALPDGVSLRLDADTRLALVAPDRFELRQGAVYVDAGSEPGSATDALVLATRYGDVRHLGTQYELRVGRTEALLSVREGRVAIDGRAGELTSTAGEQLTVGLDGNVDRREIPTYGGQWAWIDQVTPPFAIEGRPLAEFLAWAARETGRGLAYRDADAEARAGEIVLRGSIDGLSPDAALEAVLATTALRQQPRAGELLIDFRPGAR